MLQVPLPGSYTSVRATGLPEVSQPPVTYSRPSTAATAGFSRATGMSGMDDHSLASGSYTYPLAVIAPLPSIPPTE